MKIMTAVFEEPLIFCIKDEIIQLVAFKTPEHGNIKFGIEAPRTVKIHREEIYLAIKLKEKEKDIETT